ncbi:MAG: hypothetical protein ACK5Y2_13010 [Bdellovibrionales bacterium]
MVNFKLVLAVLSFSGTLWARDILFEGYYKISSADQHIGFAISRYEFDPKTKRFHSTQFTKIKNSGLDILESLSAVSESDESMTPVSYKYTSLVGNDSKTIDAKFKKGKKPTDPIKMTAILEQKGKKPVTIRNDLLPRVFLGTFLYYRMLKSAQGLQTKSNYQYDAIAEEDATVEKGSALVVGEEKFKGFTALRIDNTFKKSLFVSHVTDKGEPLSSVVKDARLNMELVPQKSEAVGEIGLPESAAITLFGSLPAGKKNVVAQYFENADKLKTSNGGKQEGFPQGQGVMIKGSATPPKEEP